MSGQEGSLGRVFLPGSASQVQRSFSVVAHVDAEPGCATLRRSVPATNRRSVTESWGFFRCVCACVYVSVCIYIYIHAARAKISPVVVCSSSLYPTVFSTEFFQVSLILVRCETSSAINMYPI